METERSPKRRVEVVIDGTKSMKTSPTDTAVMAVQKIVFFQH
jgi:hypothetical protein